MTDDPKDLLKQFFFANKWAYLASILSMILSEFVMVQFPHLLGQFTDALSAGHLSERAVVRFFLELLVVGVLYVGLYGYGQFRNGQLGRTFEFQLRRRLFAHWETLSAGYFRTRSIGDLLNHAMNDVQTVRETMSGGLNILTNSVFLLIATLFMTFRTISVSLTLVSIIPLLFVPGFIIWWGPRIRNASRKVQEALSHMAEMTEESFSAIRLVKATANETVDKRRFTERVDGIVQRQLAMFHHGALFQSMIPLMGSLSFAIALLYGGQMTLHGRIPLGSFVAFTLYLGLLLTPLQQIGSVTNSFQRSAASLARLRVLLQEQPDIRDPESPASVPDVRGDIEFRLSSYTYPDGSAPVLNDIHITVRAGETLAIVGRTASGKTTLVNLLPRIFDPPNGSVFVDGVDVHNLRLQTLRGAIAYVPQDGFLFSATIAENIGFAKEFADAKEIEEAAREACLYEDVMDFRQGFATVIGERGVTLSGGQKQRAAIARALLKDAPILILDDSLSAVDMNTEKRLIEMLRRKRAGKTTIIVAHRLSAVRHANQIIVLEDGGLIERGTHDTLIRSGGVYAQMVALQQEGEVTSG